MESSYIVRELEQVKAMADPLRTRIIEAMRNGPRTAKQVAELLGEKPTRLYHHVEALERVGILRLVETRRNRGTLEKYYEPVAKLFIVDRDLFAPERGAEADEAAEVIQGVTADMLHKTMEEIRRGIATGRIPLRDRSRAEMARVPVRATPRRLEEIMGKIHALLEELTAAEEETPPGEELDYRLLVAFYPVDGPSAR